MLYYKQQHEALLCAPQLWYGFLQVVTNSSGKT